MAEGILTHLLRTAKPPLLVESAGVGAPEGAPASSYAVEVARERGVEIRGHRARQLTRSLLDTADLVLAMERHHQEEILAMAPSMEGRVEVLTQFVGEGVDGVPDPLGGDRETYAETFDQLEGLLLRAAAEILEMAKEKASRKEEST
jgi:protein-tyrosine-phosphatase